ncbi:MAG: aspartate/glutamate racemase family protein [Leptolyngbyaceae cyanobacterium]
MKTIGLIGGMSWESSLAYYRIINETTKQRLGGWHSAKSILYSVDFAEIEALQHQHQWSAAAQVMVTAAQSLERAGADCVLLCTNTMHKLAPDIAANINIPFLHIVDATAARVQAGKLQTVGLLGTRFTMEQDFYRGRLTQNHGLSVVIPEAGDRTLVHDIIYQELCLGIVNPDSRQRLTEVIMRLIAQGAEGIILGCTELELLVRSDDATVPLFPTTQIHAEAAVTHALAASP